MITDRDPRTRIVLSWLREEAHENAERVLLRALDEVDTTPQRRSWWPAERTNQMNTYIKLIAAAAAVLVVVVAGYQFLPWRSGSGGPGATPPPGPVLLARGTFVQRDWGPVEFDATRDGSSVTGNMTVGWSSRSCSDTNPLGPCVDYFTVDLRCARTADGLIMIGGYVTEEVSGRFGELRPGTVAAVILERASVLRTAIWLGDARDSTDCLMFLETGLRWDLINLRDDTEPDIEFGP